MSNETKKEKPVVKEVVKEVVKPEMTVEQLVEKWGWPYAEEGWKMEDCTEELRADLRSLLLRYDNSIINPCLRDYVFGTTSENDVDRFLNNSQ
jgi:hypothetical protein